MNQNNVFFSYNFEDKDVVSVFYNLLAGGSPDFEVYFFDEVPNTKEWSKKLYEAISDSNYFCLFIGKEIGYTQEKECLAFEKVKTDKKLIIIELEKGARDKFANCPIGELGTIFLDLKDIDNVYNSALELCGKKYLNANIKYGDDLPINPHLFDYEKTIINFYKTKNDLEFYKNENLKKYPDVEDLDKFLHEFVSDKDFENYKTVNEKIAKANYIIHDKIMQGCPPNWPQITYKEGKSINKLTDVGSFRSHNAEVVAAALSNYHKCFNSCMYKNRLTFLEAGPREKLYYPKYNKNNTFRVAILVSGGIAPGINAVIDGITRRHYKYYNKEAEPYIRDGKKTPKKLEVWGLKNGFKSFDNIADSYYYLVDNKELVTNNKTKYTSDFIDVGGSIIGTSREENILNGSERIENLESIYSIHLGFRRS